MTQSKVAFMCTVIFTVVGASQCVSLNKDDVSVSTNNNNNNHNKDNSLSLEHGSELPREKTSRLISTEDNFHPDDVQVSFVPTSRVGVSSTDNSSGYIYANEAKKTSSFVRIGKFYPMNRFIRIGRLSKEPSFHDASEDDLLSNDKQSSELAKTVNSSPNIVLDLRSGSDDEHQDSEKRASTFVRIGKTYPSFAGQDNDSSKRVSQFVRIGKAPSTFVRIGKSPSSFVRIGKSPSSFVRIGKSPSSFVRIGKSPSSFVRIGKEPSSDIENGIPEFINTETAVENSILDDTEDSDYSAKRASSFVRIGKADFSNVDTLKDENSQESAETTRDEKRTSGFIRIGKKQKRSGDMENKRASSFLRNGKSKTSTDFASDELKKRASSFVRIGKPTSLNSSQKASMDVRAAPQESLADGNSVESQEPINISSRGSAFVRIGKIPSAAFIRIGKNMNLLLGPATYNRGSRGSQSSFVRIGK